MKKVFVTFFVVLLGVLCLNCTAFAASNSLVLITNPDGAIMYNTYEQLIIPVFYMNAVEKAYTSGEKVKIEFGE